MRFCRLVNLILLVIAMFCSSANSFAGFVVKKQEVAIGGNLRLANGDSNAGVQQLVYPKMLYNNYTQNQWYGIAAIVTGLLGLFIPGVNFLAILFGVLGMARGCKAQGLAIAGFVLGVIALIVFLLTSSVFLSLILF